MRSYPVSHGPVSAHVTSVFQGKHCLCIQAGRRLETLAGALRNNKLAGTEMMTIHQFRLFCNFLWTMLVHVLHEKRSCGPVACAFCHGKFVDPGRFDGPGLWCRH
jgi:hypothetical protein